MNENETNQENNSPPDKPKSPFGRAEKPEPVPPAPLPSSEKEPVAEDTAEKEQSPEDELLPHIRTMKYDVQHYVKEKNLSFSDLVAKQQQKQSSEPFKREERVSEKAWFRGVLGFVALIILGVGGYAGFIFFQNRGVLPSEEAPPARAFVVVEEREIITVRDGDRAGLFKKIEAARRDRGVGRDLPGAERRTAGRISLAFTRRDRGAQAGTRCGHA